MVKKEILKLDNIEADSNIMLYTIVSYESDIKVCMIINNIFKINLSLTDDLIVNSQSEKVYFKKYLFHNEFEDEKYVLLTNHNETGKYLFPEFKKIDYILLISSEIKRSIEDKIKDLKNVQGITGIFKIDPATVKSYKKIVI